MTGTVLVDLSLDVRIRAEEEDDLGLLSRFSARFHQRVDSGDLDVGVISGWMVRGCGDEDLADAVDAVSADPAFIGYIAQKVLDEHRELDPFLDDVVLVDRVWIANGFRGRGLLSPMFDALLCDPRTDLGSCVLVTEPEPQRSGGGPYPDGAERDRANGTTAESCRRRRTGWIAKVGVRGGAWARPVQPRFRRLGWVTGRLRRQPVTQPVVIAACGPVPVGGAGRRR